MKNGNGNGIGQRIFAYRKAKALSLEDVAAAIGLHRTTIGLIERGEREPTVATLLSIAKGLGVSIFDLIDDNNFTRTVSSSNIIRTPLLKRNTGISCDMVLRAIQYCYNLLDLIDTQLLRAGADSLSFTVELANLSSIIGNILGAGLAKYSDEQYIRNRPHIYPDLIPGALSPELLRGIGAGIEIKVALNKNKPKGHLPKPGHYFTFRYVLKEQSEKHSSVEIWEVKYGVLGIEDFLLSNTEGDSGKTAVIKTDAFNRMRNIFFDAALCPYKRYNCN
jgi:transcriptional regulator with XRE-family HTH domain